MKIMNMNKVVARMVYDRYRYIIVAEDWTTFIDLPVTLFGFTSEGFKREVTLNEFNNWVKRRHISEMMIDPIWIDYED